ncbi:response regulator [Thermopirellula anaerolimosa]
MDPKYAAQPEGEVVEKPSAPTVLLVDDDETIRESLSWRLENLGYRVLAAALGREALRLAREESLDAVILDICLPDVDGLHVCRTLTEDYRTSDLPIIILSAVDDRDIVQRCRAVGGQFFLAKPFDLNVLVTVLEQAANDRRWWGRECG